MPNKVVLDQIEFQNWGPYKERTSIQIEEDIEKNVIFFQGKIGTGKTSLFDAMYVGFFGEDAYKGQKFFLRSNKSMNDKINRNAVKYFNPSNDIMYIKVHFRYINETGNVTVYIVHRSWKFSDEGAIIQRDFNAKRIVEGNVEALDEKKYKDEVNSLIPPGPREFYFLDGEHLRELPMYDIKKIVELIYSISDIKLLKEYYSTIKDVEKKIGKKIKNFHKKNKKITDLIGKINKLEKEIETTEKKITQLEKNIETKSEKRDDLQRELQYSNIEEIEEIFKKYEVENKKLTDLKEDLAKKRKDFSDEMQRKLPLLLLREQMIWCKSKLNELENKEIIPRSYDVRVIMEILEKEWCIFCDHQITEEIKEKLQKKLNSTPSEGLNFEVKKFKNKLFEEIRNLDKYTDELKEKNLDIMQIKEEVAEINITLNNFRIDFPLLKETENRKKWDDLTKLDNEIRLNKAELKELLETLEEKQEENDNLVRDRTKESKKVGPEGETLEKQSKIAKDLMKYSKMIEDKMEQKIKEFLEDKSSEQFIRIIWDPEHFTGISIDEEWKMKLISKDGNELPPSAGQAHIMGISFMSSLSAITRTQIPFVFDSPFGRLTESTIYTIGQILPKLLEGSQIFLFVTDVESKNVRPEIKKFIGKEFRIDKIKGEESSLVEI